MIEVRYIRRVTALAGLVSALLVLFGGVAHADDEDAGGNGKDGRDGSSHARCDWGWVGLGPPHQCGDDDDRSTSDSGD